MGIPSFYRWLVERYPRAVVKVKEDAPVVDTSQPNPNRLEFHNLYLDMNGIIHPCFHPEGLPAPKTYDEVFKAVFKYTDRIFSIVRPRKLLYIAIDGVAPRAKMNQQRARRFRSAKSAADEASRTKRLKRGYSALEGEILATQKLDSNVITPGTEFMELLSLALKYYVHLRMTNDPGWRDIKVILSDASVPGEGEHKIMSYIRLQRNLPGFDPNTRHCLFGLDADLIMLALATHEIHFSILREDVRHQQKMYRSAKLGMQSKGVKLDQEDVFAKNFEDFLLRQKFQFLNIWVLRDYLAHDLRISDSTVKADLERLIDDFVFMCLFIGNDFLPRVASLDPSEGAIDLLMHVYKKEFVQMGGYLTKSFEVNLERVEQFVQAVGSNENAIFKKRSQVKLGAEGWKERYYTEKFGVVTEEDRARVRRLAVLKYIEGICWVMHYYYQGVCSWQWFYPYHYAPFASDLNDLNQFEICFTLGKPFKPFDQLMGVLPSASAQALPLFYRKLMTHPLSPILDFYPADFELDMNGKRYAWQAVCKLPFIKECRLLSEIAKVEHTLTDEEKKRNRLGLNILFIHTSHPLAVKIFSFYKRNKDHPKLPKAKVKRKINPKFSGGMNGYMYICDKPACPVEIYSPIDEMEMITKNEVISVFYKYPSFHSHITRPPEAVKMPRKFVSKQDIQPPAILWHNKPVILGGTFPKRPIPKSVSGPSLGKSAHQLVMQWIMNNGNGNGEKETETSIMNLGKGKGNGNGNGNGNGEKETETSIMNLGNGNGNGNGKKETETSIMNLGNGSIDNEPRKRKRKRKRRKGRDSPDNKLEKQKICVDDTR